MKMETSKRHLCTSCQLRAYHPYLKEPSLDMSVFATIKHRRSIGKMTQERPTRQQVEKLLEAATHAPNHHKVEPWKFIVLAGKAREELGVVMEEALENRLKEWLGLEPEEHIVSFLYLGFPAIPYLERHPIPFEEKTTWLGWE